MFGGLGSVGARADEMALQGLQADAASAARGQGALASADADLEKTSGMVSGVNKGVAAVQDELGKMFAAGDKQTQYLNDRNEAQMGNVLDRIVFPDTQSSLVQLGEHLNASDAVEWAALTANWEQLKANYTALSARHDELGAEVSHLRETLG